MSWHRRSLVCFQVHRQAEFAPSHMLKLRCDSDDSTFSGEGGVPPFVCLEKQREVRPDSPPNAGADLTPNFRANICTEQEVWVLTA